MANPALPSSIYLSWRMVMTRGWDIPWWIKHFFWMRILFSFFRWQRRATYFPVAEVLYHCAAQVHQRSMALVQQRYNAFHLRPNEMHFTVHFKSRGQAATAPVIYSTATFLPMKVAWAQPHHLCTQVQFLQSVAQEVHYFQFLRALCVLPFLKMHTSWSLWKVINRYPSMVPNLSPQAAKYAPGFPKVYLLCPFYQVCTRHDLSPQNSSVFECILVGIPQEYSQFLWDAQTIKTKIQVLSLSSTDIQICIPDVHESVPAYWVLTNVFHAQTQPETMRLMYFAVSFFLSFHFPTISVLVYFLPPLPLSFIISLLS